MPNEPTAPSSDFLRPELKGLKGLIAGIKDQAGSPTALVPTPEPSHTPPAKEALPRPKQGSP